MKCDIILCGVGGQGIISSAAIIANSAAKEGLWIKQVEVHSMAQRGGMVVSHLRLSDAEIASDQIPKGTAQMILSTELMESLRYLSFLSPDNGILITSRETIKNIPDYPLKENLLNTISKLSRSVVVDAGTFAHKAGSPHTANMIMLGAASQFLPLQPETLREMIAEKFKHKDNVFININLHAFELGNECASKESNREPFSASI